MALLVLNRALYVIDELAVAMSWDTTILVELDMLNVTLPIAVLSSAVAVRLNVFD